MLEFLKNLFKPKEEAKKEEISINHLSVWAAKKKEGLLSDLAINIDAIRNQLEEEKDKTLLNLETLKNAKLQNPKIPVKAEQFMQGNREAYIKKIRGFVESLKIPEGYKDILAYCGSFNAQLEILGKSTFRPYQVLQEFFAHESRDIAINIKRFDTLIKELRTVVHKSGLADTEKIEDSITHLKNLIEKKAELEKEISEQQGFLEQMAKDKVEKEKQLLELEQGVEYSRLNEQKADREVVLTRLREHNSVIVHSFSVMETALKKFARVSMDENLVNIYIEKPVNTLVLDKDLNILGLLSVLEKNISSGSIELKDKKKEKTLETIKGFNREFLEDFVKRHKALEDTLKNIESGIGKNGAEKKQDELNLELETLSGRLDSVKNRIEDNKKELDKIDIDDIKKGLQKDIYHILKSDILIS